MSDTIKDFRVDETTMKEIEAAAKKVFNDGATLGELKGITVNELDAVYQMGYGFYQTGRYDDADKVFRFLVLFDHLEPKYWTALGAVQQMKKNFAGAVASYGYAAFLDLKNPKPPYYAAECYLAMGDTENAASALAAIEAYCPADTELGKEYRAKAAALQEKMIRKE